MAAIFLGIKGAHTSPAPMSGPHYLCEVWIEANPSLAITVCHHSASLVMPNGDPWNGFFLFHLMMDFALVLILIEKS